MNCDVVFDPEVLRRQYNRGGVIVNVVGQRANLQTGAIQIDASAVADISRARWTLDQPYTD